MPCLVRAALLFIAAIPAFAQSPVLLQALAEELDRNFAVLKKADPAAYFLSYAVSEQDVHVVSANLGALTVASHNTTRSLDVSVRVGSRKLDNYRRISGERVQFTAGVPVSLDDNPKAIKQRAWLETDRVYRAAVERLIKIRTSTQVKVAAEDDSDDFSVEEPSVYSAPPQKMKLSEAEWVARLKKLSAEFRNHPAVLTSSVSLIAQTEAKSLVNTEGTRLEHGRGFARLMISGQAKAADGTDVATFESFEAVDTAGLPGDGAIKAAIERVAGDISGLLRAREVEPFVGPAILSGRAAAVFFHEIFGHRIEGHRQKDETEGQTFTKSIGGPVLPEFLSVIFDPTRRKAGATDLNGWYVYDDEGVKARTVPVVEGGILKTFLLSRSPVKGFSRSNGHGRRQAGAEPVSRQSNLIVESSRQVSEQRLRQMLIEEIKRQNKPYGYYFQHVTGGFTTTRRAGVQAFKVLPLVVYRVYPDGRKDELVRGADIVGTPLASFGKILATGDRPEVFNGYCGAESGNVPVSAVSPSLLISEIEIEKKQKSQERPPLLPPPTSESGGGL